MSEQGATTAAPAAPATVGPSTGADRVKANAMVAMKARQDGAPAPVMQKRERDVQCPPSRWHERQYEHCEHVITVESNWTMDDVMKPIFWSSLANKLRQWDKVTIQVDDGSWWAEVLITQVGIGFAFCHPLTFLDFGAVSQSAVPLPTDGYEVRQLGPHKKWCVIRTADAFAMKEQCASQREAEDWLRDFQERQVKSAAIV